MSDGDAMGKREEERRENDKGEDKGILTFK